MKALLLLIALIFPTLANAQEVVTSYDEKSLPILNEELRKSNVSIRSVQATLAGILPIDLTSSDDVSNILPIANGGTGQDTAQEAIDALTDAASADAGQVWTSDGTNGGWGDIPSQYLALKSHTPLTAVTTSGAIAIDLAKRTLVLFHLDTGGNTDDYTLSFSTGTVSFTLGGGTGPVLGDDFVKSISGEMLLTYVPYVTDVAITGNIATRDNGNAYGGSALIGVCEAASMPTTFTISNPEAMTGSITVYEYATS